MDTVKRTAIRTLREVEEISEGVDFEAKAAQGRDGNGAVPESIWETCSAFANTNGGLIFLGVEQIPDNSLRVCGLSDADKVRRDFWSAVKCKLSRSLFDDEDVGVLNLEGKEVLVITVRRASRSERPIYVGGNPMTGTYRRVHEADQRCDDYTVKAMLADAVSADRSGVEVAGFTIEDDLSVASIEAYRRRVALTNPASDFLAKDMPDFLRSIGAVRKNRSTNGYAPTLAGLLMFGNHASIKERLPGFHLDYRRLADGSARYEDRVVFDGSWSGNLFDFFVLVSQKIYQGVRREFVLNEEMQRVDETPVHVALREAFVNTLIHADYELRSGIIVVQSTDQYTFRNPGMMRVALEQALHGGLSDCRNPILQQMFRFMGAAEQMGSGVPRIVDAWLERSWQRPELVEQSQPDRTELTLRMADFLPPHLAEVLQCMGSDYEKLSREEKYTLGLALLARPITNRQLRAATGNHPRDITIMLGHLVNRALLARVGNTSAAAYVSGSTLQGLLAVHLADKESERRWVGDENHQVPAPTPQVSTQTPQVGAGSLADLPLFERPQYDDGSPSDAELEALPEIPLEESIVSRVRDAKYADQELVRAAIIELCRAEPRGVADLATLLRRNRRHLATIVSQMVLDGVIEATEAAPAHPRQRYRLKFHNGTLS